LTRNTTAARTHHTLAVLSVPRHFAMMTMRARSCLLQSCKDASVPHCRTDHHFISPHHSSSHGLTAHSLHSQRLLLEQIFFSFFKTLVGKQVIVELKNDLS
jgi:hypothetical protein